MLLVVSNGADQFRQTFKASATITCFRIKLPYVNKIKENHVGYN